MVIDEAEEKQLWVGPMKICFLLNIMFLVVLKHVFFIIKYKNVRNLKVIVFDLNIFVVLVAFIIFQSYCGLGFVLFSDTTLPLIIGCFVLS